MIFTRDGKRIYVDDGYVLNGCLKISRYGYAELVRYVGQRNGHSVYKHISMHREITGAKKGQIVDHINFNTLDNRKKNLRVVTPVESNWHRRVRGFAKTPWGYQVQITTNGVRRYIGLFKTKAEAAAAYMAAQVVTRPRSTIAKHSTEQKP